MKSTKKKINKELNPKTSESFQELMREGQPFSKVDASLLEDKKTVRTTFEGDRIIDITYNDEITAYMILKIEKQECKPYFKYLIRDLNYYKEDCTLDLVDILYMKYLEMHQISDYAMLKLQVNLNKDGNKE